MSRLEFTKATKRRRADFAGDKCERCGIPTKGKPVEYHHEKEAYYGGDNSFENCRHYCKPCHDEVTQQNRPIVDKVRRIADRERGIRPRTKKIQSRGFDRAEPQRSASRPLERHDER